LAEALASDSMNSRHLTCEKARQQQEAQQRSTLSSKTNRPLMLFDLVGSKIMTVYVAEIKGRGIAAFHANNGSDAERLVRDRVFRDDFMVLATGGLPLWDGVTDIEVRLVRPDEEVKWRA
jgi:hypothetical protein